MDAPSPAPVDQRLFGIVLILLILLALLLLFKDDLLRSAGHSRVDWPTPSSAPSHPRSP